jgi:serine/threonine-protein kinase
MGVVYHAGKTGGGEPVALKVIAAGADASAEAIARFQREARIARELDHPGIVRVLDAGTDRAADGSELAWFAMELVVGQSLAATVREREFTWQEAVTIVRGVADALAVAHARGVLHRDIKPSNILIDGGGDPHLADFGLAKDTRTESKYTRTGQTLGTPAYMSPEQARGDLAALTPASDVWALGCVLYELLANRSAFEGDSPAAVIGHVMNGEPTPLQGIPAPVATLLRLCLQKDAARRPAGGAELRDECDRVLAGRAPRRRLPRSRWPLVASVLGLLALGAVLTVAELGWLRPATPEPAADPRAARAARAERVAKRAWAERHLDVEAAADAMAEAAALAPERDDWALQLGLLRWAQGDVEAAEQAWAAVPESSRLHTRARWLAGVAWICQGIVNRNDAWRIRATQAWKVAARGTGPEAAWASACTAEPRNTQQARAALRDADDWTAQLLWVMWGHGGDLVGTQPGFIAAYDRALREGVPMAWIYNNRANLYSAAGDAKTAMEDVGRALAMDPDSPAALTQRGRLRRERGETAAALADFNRVLKARPDWTSAWIGRGGIHLDAGRHAEAIADYARAVETDRSQPVAWLNLGTARVTAGQHEAALEAIEEAIRLRPGYGAAHVERGILMVRRGRFREAEADYDAALAALPGDADVLFNRGVVREAQRNYTGAEEDFNAAIAAAPEDGRHYAWRGSVRAKLERYDEAMEDLERAAVLVPDLAMIYTNRGVIYGRRGDMERAAREFAEALRLDPTDPSPKLYLGESLMRLERWADAVEMFERYLREHPGSPMASQVQGWIDSCRARAGK